MSFKNDDGYVRQDILAEAPFRNNGFSLEFPATVPAKYLISIAEMIPDGIAVSNKNTKVIRDFVIAARGEMDHCGNDGCKPGNKTCSNMKCGTRQSIGVFRLADTSGSKLYGSYPQSAGLIYVDRQVAIKGEYRGKRRGMERRRYQ